MLNRRNVLQRLLWLGCLGTGVFKPAVVLANTRLRLEHLRQELNCPAVLLARQRADAPPEILALQQTGHAALNEQLSLPIGSAGKALLGWVFLRVATFRGLDLDTSVQTLLPAIDGLEGISLRMLGEHRSGLAEPIAARAFQQAIVAEPQRHWSLLEVLQMALDMPRVAKPGTRHAYSNANSTLLALLLERVTGLPLQQVVSATLSDAGLVLPSVSSPASLAWRASGVHGYRHAKADWPIGYGQVFTDVTRFNPSWSGAGGDWSVNIHDLLQLARMLGSAAQEQSVWLPQAHRRDYDYGFHWQRHGDLLGHLGDVPGFSSALLYQPQARVAYAAISNLSNALDGSNPAYRLLTAWREMNE